MTDDEKIIIRNFIAEKYPFHLGGYEEGWLHYKKIVWNNHTFIHIFSEENDIKEIVGTVVL
ncbi:MAG: hypothetical protein ACOC1O_04460 [bacterium]